MDIEFHYYITYLIASKAGFGKDAKTIAYASQFVDDNCEIYPINEGEKGNYSNYISQTMDITKPTPKLFRIYPLFHFIPGDPLGDTACRKDGKMSLMNTTPNSKHANTILAAALKTKDLYRIGIACHGYADTWAHQNFLGYKDGFNSMDGLLQLILPNIGHADAMHDPDKVAHTWDDGRLFGERSAINNNGRFLEAASEMFFRLRNCTSSSVNKQVAEKDCKSLIGQLRTLMSLSREDSRKRAYCEAGLKTDFGKEAIPEYDWDEWFDQAIRGSYIFERRSYIRRRKHVYNWAVDNHMDTHWFKFQEAVQAHQNQAWDILKEPVFSRLDLKEL
ncbi:MAG: DUF6765 family protein [bacterium]